jgi:SMI1 / KNR4 family.
MRPDHIAAITRLRAEVPEAFGRPATAEKIAEAEERLGAKFPGSYRDFLKEFGSGGAGKAIILGLSEAGFVYTPSIIEVSSRFRKELPEYDRMVVIGMDGSGNPVGFLPNNPCIFTHDHDFGGRYDLATDFDDYLEKALSGRLAAAF